MSREKFDLETLKATNFATNDKRHLAKAHLVLLGYEPDENETIDDIRFRCQEVTNVPRASTTEPVESAQESQKVVTNVVEGKFQQPPSLRKLPNLFGNGNGKWEGRMRRVVFQPRSTTEGDQVITARWEELKQDLIAGVPTDMPWPLYMNVLNAEDIHFEKVHDLEKTGKYKGRLITTEVETKSKKYLIQDLGDVPGTEHLPESFYDYFCKIAKQTNMFRNVARPLLLKVHGILYEIRSMKDFLGVTDQDIRVEIAMRLGPQFEEMMQSELYGEAVA